MERAPSDALQSSHSSTPSPLVIVHSSNACPEPNSWVRIAILKGAPGVREDMEKGGAWISTGGLWPGGSGVESQSVQAQAGPLYVGKASHTRGALVSHRNTE